MFRFGIKGRLAFNLGLLLICGMLLTDFVLLSFAQRQHYRSITQKGHQLLRLLEAQFGVRGDGRPVLGFSDMRNAVESLLGHFEAAGAVISDGEQNFLYLNNGPNDFQKELVAIAFNVLKQSQPQVDFIGSAWGIWWKQNRFLVVSTPMVLASHRPIAVSMAFPLASVYETLRHEQKLAFFYMLANTAVLTLIGFYFLARMTLVPIRRLVKRAEAFDDIDEMQFAHDGAEQFYGRLSNALNLMLQRISEDRRKLQATIRSLQQANHELKRTQQEMVRAEKLASVGRLSAGIAHEIGNPIGIVLGYLGLLRSTDLSFQERHDFVERAESEIKRIKQIIRHLLNFSRQAPVQPRILSVHTLIRDIVKALEVQPLLRDIQVKCRLHAAHDMVKADEQQLRQVLLNLLINAADAIAAHLSDASGCIVIRTRALSGKDSPASVPRMLEIAVQDNGGGIPTECLPNIFDPFFTTKAPGKGTGLGLAVSFKIIEAMGGILQASSTEGNGTVLTIRLPACSDVQAALLPFEIERMMNANG